jgi:intracellular septation protein
MQIIKLFWGLLWRIAAVFYVAWIFTLGVSQTTGLAQTNWVHTEIFIKLKPTIADWSFGLLILFVTTIFNRSLVGLIFGSRLELSGYLWRKFDVLLVGMFFILGALNWAVAFSMSTDVWVNYKLFIASGIYVFLLICVAGWLNGKKHSGYSDK